MAVLYAFGISHYCEKARWALDFYGIEYKLQLIAPGYHQRVAKKLGAKQSSVPILRVDEETIQGSTTIIKWAESKSNQGTLFPQLTENPADRNSGSDADLRSAIESTVKRLDDKIGVHLRRYYYSEALLEHPEQVLPIFMQGLPLSQKIILRLAWPKIRQIMTKRMDLGKGQGQESREIVSKELDWLDGLLTNKNPKHIFAEQLSIADITAASLLSPLLSPTQHPTYKGLVLPPRLKGEIQPWLQRPSLKLVSALYEKHRVR